MHLLEAALAWCTVSDDERWRRMARYLVELALDHMIDARTGVLREYLELAETECTGVAARLVEPGHQFEWAWLLLCAGGAHGSDASRPILPGQPSRAASPREIPAPLFGAAARLIEISEMHGVRNGVAVNSLLDDMTVHDAQARLWPQTERLKAHALMARLTGERRHWQLATEAAEALERYLDTGARGLWYDRRLPDGSFPREPSPASSFYHIVCAIAELASALEGAAP
jgi:mannose-6-phosphate isomerase